MDPGSTVWDVAIVGGGPAGCGAALQLRRKHPNLAVLVLDRQQFPRDKPCGDGIAAKALSLIEELGGNRAAMTQGFSPATAISISSPGGAVVSRTMREPAFVIPRLVFDDRLLTQVKGLGVPVVQHRVRSVKPLAGGQVDIDGFVRARAVIGADGAESATRRSLALPPNKPGSIALAIRGYGPELAGQAGRQIISMAGDSWPAYAWSFPVGDGTANLGFGQIVGNESVNRVRLLEKFRTLLPTATMDPGSILAHRLPLSTARPAIPNGPVLLVGDAQSLINPMTGEGIYYALISGALAAEAAPIGPGAGAMYRRLLRKRLGPYFAHVNTASRLARWPKMLDAVVSGAAADQQAFDDLVEMGLHDGLLTGRIIRAATRPGFWVRTVRKDFGRGPR